jgi:hypothetical protein
VKYLGLLGAELGDLVENILAGLGVLEHAREQALRGHEHKGRIVRDGSHMHSHWKKGRGVRVAICTPMARLYRIEGRANLPICTGVPNRQTEKEQKKWSHVQ